MAGERLLFGRRKIQTSPRPCTPEGTGEIPLFRLSDTPKEIFLSPSEGGADEGEGALRDREPLTLTLPPSRGEGGQNRILQGPAFFEM